MYITFAYHSAPTLATSHVIQPKTSAEKRLLLKADLVILPLAAFGYFAAYMDRNNFGNAKVMGFATDLHLSPNEYYSCLTIFYVGYMVFMLPVNLTLRKLKANRSIGTAVIFFGVVMCSLSVAKSFSAVMGLRFLLGVGQSFIQGLTIYTSLWYQRDELGTRSAIYYSCATLSGAFGGLIAYGIEVNLPYVRSGRYPWSWLFLIEGVIAIGAGILIVLFLPRMPDDLQRRKRSHWLFTKEEINLATDRQASYNQNDAKFQPRQLLDAMMDVKTWAFGLVQGANVLGLAVVGNFLPTFINGFGFNAVQTQLFSIIPYACAFVACICIGITSDRMNTKAPFLLATSCLAVLGYTLLLATTSTIVGIVAACFITASCYTGVILLPVWIVINTAGYTKRSCVWATSEVFAMTFSIMATRIYDTPPRYVKGHSIVLALNVLAGFSIVFCTWWMRRLNQKKDQIVAEYVERGEVHPHVAENLTLEDLQDRHILFRYIV
ncbi:major facilitator superfamily domain-containing protein [Talaromyces proteolyticus]|uniref:Major facilitator superfamily domain-containing protein n=1 Tax=Talaromyces proteolyticus TaxID=1131652 RepID=A0AAD4KTS2_9EURO|nr:major facilitator superfamily domain-containing protein [Talaromyces proteolyticus]KAH8699107.1 major facilitator superfamily domain-containing protein [Talaromyces proteolyticus]